MKLTYLFSRRGRIALAAALGLFVAAPAVSDATVIVLKEGSALDYAEGDPSVNYSSGVAGGNFGAFTQFTGLTSGDVVNVAVHDTEITTNGNARNNPFGQDPLMGLNNGLAGLFRWDLSSLPGFAGSTINAAVIRLFQSGGNGTQTLGVVTTHDYDELTATLGSPVGTAVPLAGPGEWGVGNDSFFTLAGDSTSGSATILPTDANSVKIVGKGYTTHDATADLQAMANGAVQYGWAMVGTNVNYQTSETTAFAGVGVEPALFIDYTPVPEPTSMVLLGVAAFGLTMVRKRK